MYLVELLRVRRRAKAQPL
uniref:Uncharacterized protein n=1 Tax=Arundo donax TaxID=35708 RepID=A0A0A9GZK8_ARUDO